MIARRLDRPFLDTDQRIEARAGRPIRLIFADWGEPRFRELEAEVLTEACAQPGAIVATGGGIVLREENRRLLRTLGFVVWLTGDPEALKRRLSANPNALQNRPALTPAGTLNELADVAAARAPLYRDTADAIIDTTSRTSRQVAGAVLAAWRRARFAGGPLP
jgi:shikimate kinase